MTQSCGTFLHLRGIGCFNRWKEKGGHWSFNFHSKPWCFAMRVLWWPKTVCCCTGWWFQPIWKILVKLGIFPKFGVKKPPPSSCLLISFFQLFCKFWCKDNYNSESDMLHDHLKTVFDAMVSTEFPHLWTPGAKNESNHTAIGNIGAFFYAVSRGWIL